MNKRRKGMFYVAAQLFEDDADAVRMVLGSVIVVRAECLFDRDVIEYIAIGDDFDECDLESIPPVYTPQITKEVTNIITGEARVTHKWVRAK